MFIDDKDFALLARKIDHRYCHPAIAANLDPDVSQLLDHAIGANECLDIEENEHAETKEELERLRELVRDIAAKMVREDEENLWDWAEELRETLRDA
jgi:hypothetical protein